MEDAVPNDVFINDDKPRFEILQGATQRGKAMLIDQMGYSYNVKKKTSATTTWWCSVRGKEHRCPARVKERNGMFQEGGLSHSHPARPGILAAAKVVIQSKKEGVSDFFKSAAKVVEDAMTVHVDLQAPCPALSDPTLLARRVNHHRRCLRPAEPITLDFEVRT